MSDWQKEDISKNLHDNANEGYKIRNESQNFNSNLDLIIDDEYYYNEDDDDESENSSLQQEIIDDNCRFIQFMSFEEISKGMIDLANGNVCKRIIEIGCGQEIQLPCIIAYRYKVYIENATQPLDSTDIRKTVQHTLLDDTDDVSTIIGLDIALKSMRKNEISHFIISPDFAYGRLGVFPRIPPNSSLFYEITCVDINKNIQNENITHLLNQNYSSNVDKFVESIEELKNQAKQMESEKLFRKALRIYNKAQDELNKFKINNSKVSYLVNIELQKEIKLLKINCLIKLRKFGNAARLCHEILKCDDRIALAHEYLARALWSMGKSVPALNHLYRSYNLDPTIDRKKLISDLSEEKKSFEKLKNSSKMSFNQYQSVFKSEKVSNNFILQCNQWLDMIIKDPSLNQIPSEFSDIKSHEFEYLEQFFYSNGYSVVKIGILPNAIVFFNRIK